MSSISFSELPGELSAYRDLAARAAPDAVMAMAKEYHRVVEMELRLRAHPPGYYAGDHSWTNAPAGQPPALATGELAASVQVQPLVMGGITATASVAPHTVYASVQEYGATIWHRHKKWLHWTDMGGSWYFKKVKIPERPYMRPATEYAFTSGALTRAAEASFKRSMKGLAGT